ncbi:helix-turn-helix domain-containing protein [Flavobacterium sp. LB1P62]|uniref:helix-turn-helix domain-containing protein n=1 Tax=Flavobacterium sp. LB1P62 TaxID=3401715 RepID=UPI003AAA4B60
MGNKNSKYSPLGLVVHVYENISSNISFHELVKVDCFSILIVNSGSLSIQIKDAKIYLSANEIIVIPTRSSCEILDRSDKLQISLVSFPSAFIFKNSIRRPYVGYFEFFITKVPSKVSLKGKDAVLLIDLFKLIDSKRRRSDKHIFKNEAVLFSFNLLLYELAGIYSMYSRHIKIRYTRKETIVMQFFRILESNCKTQHGVKFYADALFITTGHLTKTVKEVTEKTTKQFIEEALILEVKILLQNEDLTILYIMEELQFSNISFFSNFFKKYTAMSPSEYRLRLNTY